MGMELPWPILHHVVSRTLPDERQSLRHLHERVHIRRDFMLCLLFDNQLDKIDIPSEAVAVRSQITRSPHVRVAHLRGKEDASYSWKDGLKAVNAIRTDVKVGDLSARISIVKIVPVSRCATFSGARQLVRDDVGQRMEKINVLPLLFHYE